MLPWHGWEIILLVLGIWVFLACWLWHETRDPKWEPQGTASRPNKKRDATDV